MHKLEQTQIFPVSIDETWNFFSQPKGLLLITPPEMRLQFTSGNDEGEVVPGQIITYKVRPLFGLPVKWKTEITEVNAPYFFADEIREGPLAYWRHEHHFKTIPGGVEMHDVLYYKIPFGIFGKMANALFVRRQMEYLFAHRKNVLAKLFAAK